MTLLFAMLANHQIRYQLTHKVGHQPGDCRWPLCFPHVFVWVCMGQHTHFIAPEGYMERSYLDVIRRSVSDDKHINCSLYMARALIRRATPFFSVTVTQQQITKAAESNLVTINRVLTCF